MTIEIGNDWLKIMQAEPARSGLAVSRLYLENFDSSGPALSESISRAMKNSKFSKMPVIAYLPRQVVNIRMLELPSTDSNEIADMVDLQVGKQTPYSRDEIVSDYKIVGSDREGYCRVMLVIVQRSVLRHRFSILEDAGVEVRRMTVSSEGLLNWCRQAIEGADKATAILDIDSFYSDFVVVARKNMIFTRSILVGANQLNEDYDTWKDKLVREVKQSLEMCQSESHGKNPVRLLVSGAGPNFQGLSEYLGSHLNLPSDIMDSARSAEKMPSQPSLKDAEYRTVSITPLIGTAMAPENLEFNLVPDFITVRKGLIQKAKMLTAFGILVMTFLVVSSLYGTLKLSFKRDTLNAIEQEIKAKEPVIREEKRMLEVIVIDRERRDSRLSMVNLITEIHKLTPAGITSDLIAIDVEKEKAQVTVSGEGQSNDDVQTFRAKLEQSLLFRDVKDNTKTGDGGAAKFQIECSLEK